jgi:hypothetical protein
MLEKTESTALTTNVDDDLDLFAEAARENLQPNTGALLLYKKRKFTYGKDKTELLLGTAVIPIMHEIRHGHVKWVNGKIVKPAIGRVIDGFRPNRDVLGDHDQNDWPWKDGKQSDPWVHTVLIPMVTRDGASLFTFSTHSFFGREAAYKLIQQYAAQARQHPGHYPVIKLGTTINPTKKYGDIDGPELLIVDWADRPQQMLASLPIEVVDESEPDDKPPKKSGSFGSDMDDEIPF